MNRCTPFTRFTSLTPFLLCCVLSCCLLSCQTDTTQQLLKEAEQHRELAIHATGREEQLQEIGTALQLYLQLERQLRNAGQSPSSALYQTIGHAYALLQEPGWALFYYHQALAETPGNAQLQQQVTKLENEVGLPRSSFPRLWFDYQELLYATAALWILAFVCGSYAIWTNSARLKRVALFCGLAGILPLLAALYVAHATPLYGIIIESTPLYRLPASGPLVEERSHHMRILLAGTQVEVLSASPDPAWLMVHLKGGNSQEEQSAYIPSQSVRLIERKL